MHQKSGIRHGADPADLLGGFAMLLRLKFKSALLAATIAATPIAAAGQQPELGRDIAARGAEPALIELRPGTVAYRAAGEFTRAGKVAEAPVVIVRVAQPLAIMKTQVSAADYQRCVAERGCKPLVATDARADYPAVQVSWHDANDYARWLSRRTGASYRLPTDQEWAFAAGSRWHDDGVAVDANDPSRRSLARYERETELKGSLDATVRPFGSFGTNEHGIADFSGNVWEWTATCFTRTALENPDAATVNCGVRVVEGQHRTYVTDFIRDARAGGCAAGIPPSNLGFRLVREPNVLERWFGL